MPTTAPTTRLAIVISAGSLLACLGGGGEQPQVCIDYLDCETASAAMALEPTYGAAGTCWDQGKDGRQVCEDACTVGLAACEADTDTDSDSDSDSDSDTDSDSDADGDFTVTWSDDDVKIHVTGATSGFDFGMADTANGTSGWYGEDCLYGTSGYYLCHSFDTHDGTLDSIYDEVIAGSRSLEDIWEGETTLLDDSWASGLTYVVTFDSGFCMVSGHDPYYYLDSSSFYDCEIR